MSGRRSKDKGKRGECLLIDLLEENGYPGAVRAQKARYTSGKESGDVEHPDLEEWHLECKNQERLNVWKAWEQAENDAQFRGKIPVLAIKRNRSPF